MKKTMRLLGMAAIAFVGVVMIGCSKGDVSIIDNSQQPENTSKIVTLTTTVGLDGGAETRALTSTGVKTFAAGEKMAVIYNNGTSTVKAVSNELQSGDLIDGGKSAIFTFDLETPNKSVDVTYIYPASMAKADGSVNYDALATQDGTLASFSSNLDLATKTAAWEGTSLPTATLDNQLVILALTLKDGKDTEEKNDDVDVTNTITRVLLSDGTNSYNVTRSAGDGPIYVAIRPTTSANISLMAQGSKVYKKSLTNKSYDASNGYSVNWLMEEAFLADALADGVKVKFIVKYNNENWSVVEGTYSSGSFTDYVNGDGNGLGTEIITSLSMSMDGDNLVVYLENPYDNNKVTFRLNTTDNTYTKTISSNDPGFGWCFKDLKSITINGFDFTNQMTDSDAPVAPTLLSITIVDNGAGCGPLTFYYLEGESWKDAIDNHSTENAGWGYEIDEDTGDPEMPPLGRVFYNYDYTAWDLNDEDWNQPHPNNGIDPNKSYFIGYL